MRSFDRSFRLIFALMAVVAAAAFPLTATAQSSLSLEVAVTNSCDEVAFNLSLLDGIGNYEATFLFGDGETALVTFEGSALEHTHSYPTAGSYDWMVEVRDLSSEATGVASGSVQVGPQVTLNSVPFPPVLTLEGGTASAEFSAEVSDQVGDVSYLWDLNGDGTMEDETASMASFEYTEGGKYSATVEVTDSCGLPAADTLPVVVFDPEDACHPRAQQIAEAVSNLFPGQSEDTYSCEDIFGIFNGDLTGDQLGFGRMWHAYQLASSLEELTWQEILDWHLNEGGWGLLTQLDRYSEAVSDLGLRELTEMVVSGEASVNEIRTAVRSVVKHEADFEDALSRLQEGASPGEISQFYRLANELEVEPGALDEYLDQGMSLPELRHLSSLSGRFDTELEELAQARQQGASWGELNQAYRLSNDEMSGAEILELGVKQYRESQRQQQQELREQDRQDRALSRLAEQYGLEDGQVQSMFEFCQQDLSCVRQQLRDQEQDNRQADRNTRTAERLAAQYGAELSTVWSLFNGGECSGDWNCVRKTLREANQSNRGKNK